MKHKTIPVVTLVVFFICWFSLSGLAAEVGVTKDTIKIGLFGPLTGQYTVWWKIFYELGAMTVLNEVNGSGGIHGRKLELITEDDAFITAQSVTAVRKLIDKGAFAILGGINTPGVEACRPIIAKDQIPFFTPSTGGDGFLLPYNTDPSGKWMFGGTLPSQRVQIRTIVDFAKKKGAKRIAIIYHPNSWGKEGYESALSRMDEYKLKFVGEETSLPDATDLSVQILKLKEKQPDFIINVEIPRPTMIFVRQAHELGLKATICCPGGSIMDQTALTKAVGVDALADFYYVTAVKDKPTAPVMAKWRQKLEKAHPEMAGKGDFPNVQTFMIVGGTLVFVEGLKRAGPDLTREKFRNALENIKDFDTEIHSHPISFSPTNHIGLKQGVIVKFDGKEDVYLK